MRQKLKIACFGQIRVGTGSGGDANYMMLEELLKRDYEIDFYGWTTYNKPEGLLGYKNLCFIDLPQKSPLQLLEHKLLPPTSWFIKNVYPILHYLFVIPVDGRILKEEIVTNHITRQYDLLLFLGVYAPFRINAAPTVCWVQGPPQTEWLYIKKLREKILKLNGLLFYLKATVVYSIEKKKKESEIKNSDVLICGSTWSREEMIAYGIPPKSIKVLPFPIDMQLFDQRHQTKKEATTRKTLLWLGRIEPRKRFDLLMEAYALLLKERQDVHLKVVGNFKHVKGYRKLLDSFENSEFVEYTAHLDRSQVPNLIKQCDVLIQPSEGENFGSSVAEALCCGLPVIVGSTNGTKDYISSTSFVFEEYTPESLKQTMIKAIEAVSQNPELLAEDARQTAEKNFDILKVVDDLEDIFKQSIQSKGGDIRV